MTNANYSIREDVEYQNLLVFISDTKEGLYTEIAPLDVLRVDEERDPFYSDTPAPYYYFS